MEGDLFLNGTSHEFMQTVCKYVQILHLFSAEDLEGTEDRVVFATESNSTFFECIPRSPQATTT